MKRRKTVHQKCIKILSFDNEEKRWLVLWSDGSSTYETYNVVKDFPQFEEYVVDKLSSLLIEVPSYIN
jgi:hypothetical protein